MTTSDYKIVFQKHQNYKTKTAVYETNTKTTLQDQDQRPFFGLS